jgi:putative transposase
MPRRCRRTLPGVVFHVMNRAVRRTVLFENENDYRAFVALICESLKKHNVKIISYALMPNHWHLVIICGRIKEMSKWAHWFECTHANRWNGAHGLRGTGAVYQGRFQAVPVQSDQSLIRLCRYVERNPLRKGLVAAAEEWQWSSLYDDCNKCGVIPLEVWPIPRPENWVEYVNTPENEAELEDLRRMLRKNLPIGTKEWQAAVAPFIGASLRERGRPKGTYKRRGK